MRVDHTPGFGCKPEEEDHQARLRETVRSRAAENPAIELTLLASSSQTGCLWSVSMVTWSAG